MVILDNIEPLNDANFIDYCARHYNNPQCHTEAEFLEDVQRIKYIKKLITRYHENGELREQLILNHIIILNNIFGPIHTCRLLFQKLPQQFHYIKPFLLLLSILPDKLYNINDIEQIDLGAIVADENITCSLRKFKNA